MILSKLMETPMNTNPVRTAATPASTKKNSCHSLICTLLLVVVACTDSGSVGTPSVVYTAHSTDFLTDEMPEAHFPRGTLLSCLKKGTSNAPSVDLAALVSCSALLDGCEVRGGRNLHEVVDARAPLPGKNSRTGRSRPASESTMNTIWWTCSLPGGNPPVRCAVQKTG